MMHTSLCIGVARTSKLVEDFRINHRSPRLQPVFAEKPGGIELEGAIDIAHAQPENQAHQHLPAPGVQLAYPRILTMNTVSQYGVIFLNESKEAFQVTNIKLPVRIHEENKGLIAAHRLKTAHQRRSIPLIDSVVQQAHTPITDGNLLHNRLRAVLAPIVNHNDLEIQPPLIEDIDHRPDGPGDCCLLIMRGQHD